MVVGTLGAPVLRIYLSGQVGNPGSGSIAQETAGAEKGAHSLGVG